MRSTETSRLTPAQVARSGLCIGCGACAAKSGPDAVMAFDRFGELTPRGAEGGDAFDSLCPFSPSAHDEDELALEQFPTAALRDDALGHYEAAYVGNVAEGDFRMSGSSGGMASWLASELLRQGRVDGVAHVRPNRDPAPGEPLFRYAISHDAEELTGGAKSRYYPVELSAVLRQIAERPGRYAVVGIPCFIKAVRLLQRQDPLMRERIAYTLGLFCGHMKSARMVESFAWQMGAPPEQVREVDFRHKDADRPANWYTAALSLAAGETRFKDWWSMADGDWGAGFFQNSACDFCDDVMAETADISFGDAWVEPYASDGRGTNVVVARTREMVELLNDGIETGRVTLAAVDAVFVRDTQAAGLRQRREGLVLRMARRRGPRPRKRAWPDSPRPSSRRRFIYRLRGSISFWSHRVFFAARKLHCPWLYITWARGALRFYQGVTYSRGWIGEIADRVETGAQRAASWMLSV